jgi:hypothetical protein
MLKGRALDAAIRRLPSRPLKATYFRAIPLRFATDPLGKNRPISAQRFNVKDGARVLYLAADQVTCLHEAQLFGSPLIAAAVIPLQLDLRAVVDLRDNAIQKILRTNAAELSFNFRSLGMKAPPAATQLLGERVAAGGRIDGLIYESPAYPGHNDLAVIESALGVLGSSLVVDDPGGVSDRLG